MEKLLFAIIALYGQGIVGCPDGPWVDLGESCYLISMDHFGWENAQIVTETFRIVM